MVFDVLPVTVDEQRLAAEQATDHVCRLALAKARAGAGQAGSDVCVLGADTVVVVDGEIFGKPVDADGAAAMLRRLPGARTKCSAPWRGCIAAVIRCA